MRLLNFSAVFAIAAVSALAGTLPSTSVRGEYVEARTADVYTGPCFANAEVGLTGDLAVMGWKIDKGYLWNEGGRLIMHYDDFANYCGTSLIVQSRLYDLPVSLEAADIDYVKSMLGSHVRIGNILAERGTPLEALPFRGAIYRVGHSGAHSKSSGLLATYFFNTSALRRPRQLLRNLRRVRPLDRGLRNEFFGAASANNVKW